MIKRSFSIDDISRTRTVSNAQLSADGQLALCVITEAVNNSWNDSVVLIDVDSGEQKNIANGSGAQWSPDGKSIAYIGSRNENAAIFLHDLESNINEFIVDIYESDYFIDHYANKNFCWSPDGNTIAYVSTGPYIIDNETPYFREFTDLLYKTKGGRGRQVNADKRRSHIWLVSIKERDTRPVYVSDHNEHSIFFSPDGEKICFISNTTGSPDLNQWSKVFSVDILTGEVHKISNEVGSAFQPSWSPDGKFIAHLGITNEISTNDSPAEDTQLYLVPASGDVAICLTSSLNRRIEQVSWGPSSEYVYFTAGNSGTTSLYRVSINTGKIEEIINCEGKVTEYSCANDGKNIIYIHTDTTHPGDVFVFNLENHTGKRLTDLRVALSNKCILQAAETFWFNSFDNLPVQGWLIKPANVDLHRKYPLILVIHGGPHNMFGYEFEDRMQLLAASGYGVLFINPRGSSGYGQEFSNGCVKAWGEGDYEDLMYGVDAILENQPWVDASKLGVTGQSYGGYMTNRIITKTQRFKAAVADGSISNLISFAGTSLYHSLMESEYQQSVYDNYDALWKCSPIRDVKNVSTPVLFLHGETDNEVPISQAEEIFVALKKLGVTTSFIQYVGEGHGWRPDLRPNTKVHLLTKMLEWFDCFLKNNPGAPDMSLKER